MDIKIEMSKLLLKRRSLNISYAQLHSKWHKMKYPTPNEEDKLPVFVYATENTKPHNRVYTMGMAYHGALGLDNLVNPKTNRKPMDYMHRPHRLLLGDTHKVTDITCGFGFTLFATKASKNGACCFGTGINSDSQIGRHISRNGIPYETVILPSPVNLPIAQTTNVTKIASGRAHSLFATTNEGVWSVGNNAYGQCGRPVLEDEDYTVNCTFHHIKEFDEKNVDQIECGQDTSFVLSDGVLYSCGLSTDGQTGVGCYDNQPRFKAVCGDVKGEYIVKVASAADCVMALSDKGDIFVWGNSEYRQLSSITDEQQVAQSRHLPLNFGDKVVDVAASGTACFVLTETGEVYSWGYGILGRGPKEDFNSEPKVIPSTLLGRNVLQPDSKVTKLFAGTTMVAAVTNQGGLYTWGRNVGGCLGLGHTDMQYFPLRVCIAGHVQKVSCGIDHMAVMAKSLA